MVAKRRQMDEHADRVRVEPETSYVSRVGATVQRLPDCFRNAAKLLRQGTIVEPNRNDTIAHSPYALEASHDSS